MALSVRTRFEVFKRDGFTCQYCGRKSPEVVLEVDHIIPRAGGGTDDEINLRTSCWDCNRGKRDVPLADVVTGEDPHDRAVMVLERERQLAEYNRVMEDDKSRREHDTWILVRHWNTERGITGDDAKRINTPDYRWFLNALKTCPREQIREFIDYALFRDITKDLRYVKGCVRSWREQRDLDEAFAVREAEPPIRSGRWVDDDEAESIRRETVEEVLLEIRETEYRRRNVGACMHDPSCTTFSDCVQRTVRGHLLD